METSIMKRETPENSNPLWMKIAYCWSILGLILCTGAMFVYPIIMLSPLPVDDILSAFRFLPSDEAMIENFHKHRQDFERLLQIYRESRTLYIVLQTDPEVKQLMNRIGAHYMYRYMYSDQAYWSDHDSRAEQNGIIFDGIHEPVLRLKTRTRVAKQYYYIPGIPKTEHGVLIGPHRFRSGPLRKDLNTYPPDFMCHDCVAYREIEPHWYLRLTQE